MVMKHLQKLVFFFFLFLIPLSGDAQLTYVDGYIVKNTGDTLRGRIKYNTPAQRSVKCVFQANGTNEKITHKPFSIKGYSINGDFYESKIYDFDPSLSFGYGVFMIRQNIGTVQVYHYWNTDKERGFTQTFIENDGDYLLAVDYLNFRKQMLRYFEDYPELQSSIRDGDYKKKDLMEMVRLYNEWKANEW